MNVRTLCVAAAVSVVVLGGVVNAQWISYPVPGAPRLPDGRLNLKAPAPRTSDGKPDLSGIWLRMRPVLKEGARWSGSDWEHFVTADSEIQMRPWAEALYNTRKDNFGAGQPSERCLPHSFQHQVLIPQPIQVVQTPLSTTVLFEELNHFRQIFTDGRPHPSERPPTWFGYSVGKWDGDTMVVETVGFRDQTWLDGGGHPGTETLRTVERYGRRDFGHLELKVTIDDPAAYVKPWMAVVQFELMADASLIEHVCENERSAQHIVGK